MFLNKNKNNKIITEEYDDIDYGNYEINDLDFEDAIEEEPKSKKIMNIISVIILALAIMVAADMIAVTKYDKGPYFAIRTKTYDDGGTQVFYGLGYKVIKYHQEQGRRDTELGFWSMSYSVEKTEVSALDLAIEFRNKPEKTAEKFVGQFVEITGTIKQIEDNKVILQYDDPDDMYTLRINCPMAEKTNLDELKEKTEVTVTGTIESFTLATTKNPNMVNMSNCFITEK